jgi:hypothetical protein
VDKYTPRDQLSELAELKAAHRKAKSKIGLDDAWWLSRRVEYYDAEAETSKRKDILSQKRRNVKLLAIIQVLSGIGLASVGTYYYPNLQWLLAAIGLGVAIFAITSYLQTANTSLSSQQQLEEVREEISAKIDGVLGEIEDKLDDIQCQQFAYLIHQTDPNLFSLTKVA